MIQGTSRSPVDGGDWDRKEARKLRTNSYSTKRQARAYPGQNCTFVRQVVSGDSALVLEGQRDLGLVGFPYRLAGKESCGRGRDLGVYQDKEERGCQVMMWELVREG
jgi:hypothetical protein